MPIGSIRHARGTDRCCNRLAKCLLARGTAGFTMGARHAGRVRAIAKCARQAHRAGLRREHWWARARDVAEHALVGL